jgi:hypothetical protein
VDSLLKVATRNNKMYSVKNGLKLLPNGVYAKKKGFLETREQSSKFLDVMSLQSVVEEQEGLPLSMAISTLYISNNILIGSPWLVIIYV